MSKKWEYMQLRNFTEAELIFDEQETKEILIFFFDADQQLVESKKITSELRNLAQGLLVAAVDASYAMGWVEMAFSWSANPGAGFKKAVQKLARSAARHWFKHLKHGQSLINAKIYDSVRNQLTLNFRSYFRVSLQAKAQGQRPLLMAKINCAAPKSYDKIQG